MGAQPFQFRCNRLTRHGRTYFGDQTIPPPYPRRPQTPPQFTGPRFNEFIVSPKVRVIDENGENLGVMFTKEAIEQAGEVAAKLTAAGIRCSTDLRNEKINYKVREHSLAKVPLLLVVGKREAQEGTVAVRRPGSDDHQKMMTLDDVIAMISAEAVAPDLKT